MPWESTSFPFQLLWTSLGRQLAVHRQLGRQIVPLLGTCQSMLALTIKPLPDIGRCLKFERLANCSRGLLIN